MKTTAKFLLTIIAVLMAGTAFSQSNEQGTIQIGLGWNATLGGATIKATPDTSAASESDATGIRIGYGLRGQYGLSDNLSAGIYVRFEAAVYVPDIDINNYFGGVAPEITYSGTAFGLEGKYYLVNSDNFNFFPAISVGYTTGSNEIGYFGYTNSYDISGLNYSAGIGLNWYFVSEVFGISFDLGYQGTNLSGTQEGNAANGIEKTEYTVSNGGVYWGFGLTAHFGD
ncbi:MAG TPA: hypothetical protein VI757_10795 [Bacteroidia bacterium]|nr:hypothetical protein [Bacteroidia bacterium]